MLNHLAGIVDVTKRPARVGVLAALLLIACAFGAGPASAAKYIDSFIGSPDTFPGDAGGVFNQPRGVAVDNGSGDLFVLDAGNQRVQRFSASGEFLRAWGRDVVGAGPGNADERQRVTVTATGGSFTLTFTDTTAPIAWNATAATVQAALEALPSIGVGNVLVSGGSGGPWLVTFIGTLADANRAQMTADGTGLTGPTPSATVLTVADGGNTFEVCVPANGDVCQGGTANAAGGSFSFGFGSNARGGIAVNQASGDVYVTDAGNLRVSQYTAAGQFVRTWGLNVVTAGRANDLGTTSLEVCDTTTSPANDMIDCKVGVSGAVGGAFAPISSGPFFDGFPAVAPAGAPNAGNVVIADPGNRRVQEFTAAGGFVRAFGADVENPAAGAGFEICTVAANCKAGVAGSAAGQFGTDQPKRVAVDTTGAIYATEPSHDGGNFRVQKFTPQVGPPALSPAVFAPAILSDIGEGLAPSEIVVDPTTNRVFVTKGMGSGVSTCFDGSPSESAEARVIELTASGTLVDQDTLACSRVTVDRVFGLAFRPATGRLYLSSTYSGGVQTAHRVYVLDDDGITPAIGSVNPPTSVSTTTAELSATVNPNSVDNNFEPTNWRLEYSVNGVDWTAASTGSLPAGTTPTAVTGTATDLEPSTLYRVRVVTSKPFGNPPIPSAELTFVTAAAPPELSAVRATAVTADSARLTGQVNPRNTPTSYRFEWGIGNFDNVVPVPDGLVGSGSDPVFVSEQLSNLEPNTTYQFRLVATSETQGATTSAVQAFTTVAVLPPGARGYELVSPADKYGGVGVGEWYKGPGSFAGTAGIAAYDSERFAAQGRFGSTLVNGAHSYSNDWAFADRVSDQVGWRSHSPLTHPNARTSFATFMDIESTSEDLGKIYWNSNFTPGVFPELVTSAWASTAAGIVSDWGSDVSPTRWELFGPQDPSQLTPDTGASQNKLWDVAQSADGSYAAGTTALELPSLLPRVVGLGGTQDPTNPIHGGPAGDLVSGRSIYLADLSAPLADTYVGTPPRTLLNVCTGSAGVNRTEVPAVDGTGNLIAAECAPPPAGRERLVSPRGASLSAGNNGESGTPENVISADGSRVFFLSPDPQAGGVPDGSSAFCTAAGQTCPPQLYVRQRNDDGTVTVRWLSRAADGLFGAQDASLTGAVRFEGATPDGDKVFFRTNSPLTADDPNGAGGPVPVGGVTTGLASNNSWDLYVYDLPDGPNIDPADGQLTRISAGPDGNGDCNSPLPSFALGSGVDNDRVGALRFASDDGMRAYFVCSAPLAAVPTSANGTVTSPGGSPATTDATNLYLYDAHEGNVADRWSFVARLPRSTTSPTTGCASAAVGRGSPLMMSDQLAPILLETTLYNCVRGSSDGGFITLWTTGRLTADDPPATTTGDIYGYDADRDELSRVSANQGGAGGAYECASDNPITAPSEPVVSCNGDGGLNYASGGRANVSLGVATDPESPGERTAFFHSRSRLVPADADDAYDVYQWRDGELSLLSTGQSDTDGAFYVGNDRDGGNVYFATRDRLTWQDFDSVADVYTARVDGGIDEPVEPAVCAVLAGACHGGDAPRTPTPPTQTNQGGGGNAEPGARRRLAVAGLSRAARRAAARSGVISLKVRASSAGVVRAAGTARIGKRVRRVTSGRVRLKSAGRATLRLRLNRAARRQLGDGKALRVSLRLRMSGADSRTTTVRLRRPGR